MGGPHSLPQEYVNSAAISARMCSEITSMSSLKIIKKILTTVHGQLPVAQGWEALLLNEWWHLTDVQHLPSPWLVSPLGLPGCLGVSFGSLLVPVAITWSLNLSVSCLACFLAGLTGTCAHLLFFYPDSSSYMCSVALPAFFD